MFRKFSLAAGLALMLVVAGSRYVAQASPPDLGAEPQLLGGQKDATCIGQWDVDGQQCTKVGAEDPVCEAVEDTFTFLARAHRFRTESILKGKWRQRNDRVRMKCHKRTVKRLLRQAYEGTGVKVLNVKRWTYRGTITDDTIDDLVLSGKYFIKYEGQHYRVIVTGEYTATRLP